ncbi:MobA/MobL family protein [Priestia megaterium]|uniref:MobA/MobL family protein n=1 Tax=Priestia megaterium TaxID=1404 RepID=UPI0012BA1273|nr:MobA/MobL family protein [Priestia megaterium]
MGGGGYRSGEKVDDEGREEEKFYGGDVEGERMMVSGCNCGEWMKEGKGLWNEVEKVEKGKE